MHPERNLLLLNRHLIALQQGRIRQMRADVHDGLRSKPATSDQSIDNRESMPPWQPSPKVRKNHFCPPGDIARLFLCIRSPHSTDAPAGPSAGVRFGITFAWVGPADGLQHGGGLRQVAASAWRCPSGPIASYRPP